jgi:hypothetical protein
VDIGLPGGWHVTIFHPWVSLAAIVCVLLVCWYLLKFALAHVFKA